MADKPYIIKDPLVDRNCVLLDGNCNCESPFSDCRYYSKSEEEIKEQIREETPCAT